MRRAGYLVLLTAAANLTTAAGAGDLVTAARDGDRVAALDYIASGADVDGSDADGTTALHWAVYHDDVELIEALIAAGADASASNAYGSTAMSEAAIVADVDVLELLLDAGADVDSPNAEGQTALMAVARTGNVEAARLLLAAGANVNARETWKHQTALMWAAAQSQPEMLSLLIEHGAEVDARSRVHDWKRQVTAEPRAKHLPTGGLTPLLFAARQGCLDCVRSLVASGADVNLTDPDAITPLLMALLNARFDIARYLVAHGANVNKWDWWGRTPLYAAVDYNTIPVGGRPDLPALDEATALDIIELLLEAGANPNAQLKLLQPFRSVGADRGADPILGRGTTPLIRAAKAADIEAMRLLIDHGALLDLPQDQGVTPLMAAAGLRSFAIDTRGRYRTEAEALAGTRLLLDAGADLGARERSGQTAVFGAASQGWNSVVELLAERGADLSVEDDNGFTPIDAALGRIRGPGRAGSVVNVHEDTAALIESLLAAER
jgi:ankyrin repeat protein